MRPCAWSPTVISLVAASFVATACDASSCEHPRQFGDYGSGLSCWDPPDNYCAQGETLVVTAACNPDNTACCILSGGCQPCGWRSCSYVGERGEVSGFTEEGCPEPAEVTRLAGHEPRPEACQISHEPFCP